MQGDFDSEWVHRGAAVIGRSLEREIAALVDVSSPSGDVEGAEAAVAVATALLPGDAKVERLTCSSPDHADDLLASIEGSGSGRLLLLGHLDTVISHAEHHPIRREGERLYGPGTIDMKGGVAISLGIMCWLASQPEFYGELALLLAVDEEWRQVPFAHADRFAEWDACLCFEAGELNGDGEDAVVVARKAAGTVEVIASGVASHSGSEPDDGRSALLALSRVALDLAELHDLDGPDRRSVVPTILNSGEAFNIVPGEGKLYIDSRAASLEAIERLIEEVPSEIDGVELKAKMGRRWPAMDMAEAARGTLERASELLGRPIIGAERGGASDASHLAAGASILAIDGLGPLGAGSHAADEHLLPDSLVPRTEVALGLVAAILDAAPSVARG